MRWLLRADWLSGDRARAYGNMLAIAVLVFAAVALVRILGVALGDAQGRPLGGDFAAFWSGGRLALLGHAAATYDPAQLLSTEQAATQLDGHVLPYLYPPIWIMLCLPLGALPYGVALVVFEAACTAGLLVCLRRFWPQGWPLLPLLALPAAAMNVVIGQNGCLTALCFAGAALLLDRRPVLAGLCLGCLAIKPQLAICVPMALLAARRFRALAACGMAAGGLAALSWAVLGGDVWRAFLAAAPSIGSVLKLPEVWPKTVSVFAAVRHFGGGVAIAGAVQAAACLGALIYVGLVCARRPGAHAELGLAIIGAMLSTPYLMDYDLACLAIPLAWLACTGLHSGFRGTEKLILAAGYLAPLGARGLNLAAGVPLVPVLLLSLTAAMAIRLRREQNTA